MHDPGVAAPTAPLREEEQTAHPIDPGSPPHTLIGNEPRSHADGDWPHVVRNYWTTDDWADHVACCGDSMCDDRSGIPPVTCFFF
ncbi:MAG: hypothetical protein Q8P67_06840 [archaeon]|nr:hypothetical protein [archaeon]